MSKIFLNDFKKYIKAVGTGPKGNRDLSFEDSKDMMKQILDKDVHPQIISAFLLGWKLKPETIEEFRGALSALDGYIIKKEVNNSIELGYPFDGKAKNPYLFPIISKILKNSELNLVIVGDELQPAKDGVTTKDICSNIMLHSNTHYFDRKDYCKELHDLTEIRQRLTLRSGINTIEKLPNIAKSAYAITGVHHTPYVKKYTDIFGSRYTRFALIQGNEGSPELFSKGKLWINQNNNTTEYLIDPTFYGIDLKKSTDILTLKESLDILKNPSEDLMKLAKLNAAILLFVADKFNSIEEAYESL